jgi:hypothetical protein
MKKCTKCLELKSLEDFTKKSSRKDGKSSHCKECENKRDAIYREQNKQKIKDRRKSPEYKEKLKEQKRRYYQKKYHSDGDFRMMRNLRSRTFKALNGELKQDTTINLLGCSLDEFKLHLESLWQEGMNWDNYSYEGWHIDHIRPCSSFDLLNIEEQKECFHFSNLQPLWAKDNLLKGSKW